ncbi:pyrimidine-specific ribonucleoside hydrolase RihA [Ornithinimicrobium humiphilum]|uniref:Purine nucleosidase/pyrimidine-specific ribonucleoside hydrolase n=1 Tax=Ornithinimicrobium humiphilum TaxID=125288 RepID=A0A543KRE7_9MICO|nr:nucleoside hydrolase [Ornithinimicrobium humiphilum]TQM97652.1 purine nucleosidase/pyrimidine-specific ribonucleoside hydrolase [Ornithinimicrobium humiphilum]
MSRPLVIDCDPGHDDALALLLAVASPTLDLRAVTTCFGNCSVEDATRNALRVLTLAGATHVPVGRGAEGPLSGDLALGNYVHGVSGLDGPDLPEPAMAPDPRDAVELLADVLRESSTGVVLAVTGPMTNVARLVQKHPDLVPAIAEVIFMGGSTERGNHTPTAEFNTYADPEALDVVLQTGLPVRMVGLNLTHQALATADVVRQMAEMDHVVGQTCAGWMGFFGDSYRRVWEFDAPPVHDPCTIVALIDPDVVTWREAFLAVELEGRWTRGTTVVDLHGRYPDQAPNAQVATRLDRDRYWEIVLDAVRRLGSST